MSSLLESILDTEQDIAAALDSHITETKKSIIRWMCDNSYSSGKNIFRMTEPRDIEVDDDLLISVTDEIDYVSISSRDIPEYIRFKYVGTEFKVNHSGTKKGDASFLLKYLSKQGKKDLKEIWIEDCTFKRLGDFHDLNLWMFIIKDNPDLKMKASELPVCDVTLEYKGNGNEFKPSDVYSKMKHQKYTRVHLDHGSINVKKLNESVTQSRFTRREIDESILDSDDSIGKSVTSSKQYYVARYAKILVEVLGKRLDFKKSKTLDHDSYVLIPLKNDFIKKIINTVLIKKDKYTVNQVVEEVTQNIVLEIFEKCRKENLTVESSSSAGNVMFVSNWWFCTFKIGDPEYMRDDPEKRIYPSMGITILDADDFTNSKYAFLIDLDEYNKELVQYLHEYAK